MLNEIKKTTVIALIVGLLIGTAIGIVTTRTLSGWEINKTTENKKDENIPENKEPTTPLIYQIRKIQLRERVKAYTGIIDSIKNSAGITENQDPETIAEKTRNWLGEAATCRHYSTLTFTILASQNYENLNIHIGYVTLGENKEGHMWLTWKNKTLDYPKLERFPHTTENKYSKNEFWETN